MNRIIKPIVVLALLLAVGYGAYRVATTRGPTTVASTAQGAYYGRFTAHTHPAGTVPHGDGGVILPVPGAPTAKDALINIENAVACELGGGALDPTVNGVTGARETGTAVIIGGAKDYNGNATPRIQRIAVKVVSGRYSPNVIRLKAGVPAEVTFGQSTGCTNGIMSKALGFKESVLNGPYVARLSGGLKKGTYQFSCNMGMIAGVIVVY